MLSELKVGDSAWSVTLGECRVAQIHNKGVNKRWEMHDLTEKPRGERYLQCGRTDERDAAPTCYPERPKWAPPPAKMVNGIPVPDIGVTDTNTSPVYVADPTAVNWVMEYDGDYATMVAKRGLAYPRTEEGKEAARLHAMALLGLKPV